jgi:hypothetical protein
MYRVFKVFGLIVMLVVVMGIAADTSTAKSFMKPHHYTTYMAKCGELAPEEVWETGEVLHLRGVVSTGTTFGEPYFSGTFENRTDIDLNLATGKGDVQGTVLIMPNAYDGSWQGDFKGHIFNFMFKGHGVDFGSDELEGLTDIVHVQEISPSELPAEFENPCGEDPVLGAFQAKGVIIDGLNFKR